MKIVPKVIHTIELDQEEVEALRDLLQHTDMQDLVNCAVLQEDQQEKMFRLMKLLQEEV